jgi:hypothetical protein
VLERFRAGFVSGDVDRTGPLVCLNGFVFKLATAAFWLALSSSPSLASAYKVGRGGGRSIAFLEGDGEVAIDRGVDCTKTAFRSAETPERA